MGENKGHGNKAPNYPELDEMGSAANRAGQGAGNQQRAENQQDTGQLGSIVQGSSQRHTKQQGSEQHGSQHASGGTPALDDLNADLDSRNRGSLGNAAQQMDQTRGWDGKQDKNR